MFNKKIIESSRELLDYKLHITVLICVLISQAIGTVTITITSGFKIIILPLIFSLILVTILYLEKYVTWITKKQSKTCGKIMLIIIGPLIAKLAITSGQNIDLLVKTGIAIFLEELGDIGSIFIALPVALLLGFKRESIGMTSSICREPQMAVIIDKYGLSSDEVKGFMIVYLIGIILGTIFISIIASFSYLIPLHPYAYALACGVGSTSMNVAAVSSLITLHPDLSNQLLAFSGISNLISLILGVYVYILVSLPLTEKLYAYIEPIVSKYIFKR
ncbi:MULTISPECIES: DUF3100 domain-containing protein [Methanosphaera]|uniref:Conserved hypothetical membrane-spanning protein n=1 Tax=Methanosphaera stadtmanae (strain ATCC 43021 / DSM 3091 / JCM 11832 / MCB-3) TaxID=339860 RepID=Q2NGH4_METST|nr:MULTISPECIES: DUF3100 domain-containing protein [Methanosphaera]ABC57079.1 conserved hypothetical membrane-spanning protein [Methanosphaera stadtmanae DSM 3091]OEC90806.1 hypothetical protein A9758_07255 [Methanosphaera sp. A6]